MLMCCTSISVEAASAAAAQLLRELDIAGSYAFAACAATIEEAAGPGAMALPVYALGAQIEAHVAARISAEIAEDPGTGSFPYPKLPWITGGRLFLGWGRTVVSVRPAGVGRYVVELDATAVSDDIADRGGTAAEAREAVEEHPRYQTMVAAGAR